MNDPRKRRTYIAMTLDPVHIGSGGYRLGRVDNSIVRDPGTDLPKVPGTSFSGAVRSYAAYLISKPRCAGQGQPESGQEATTGHCGKPDCPICYTFGYTKREGDSYAGVVNLFDAQILLFPVRSMYGPVWVTTEEILKGHGRFPKTSNQEGVLEELTDLKDVYITMSGMANKDLNLGWLLFRVKNDGISINNGSQGWDLVWPYDHNVQNGWERIPGEIRKRIVIVHPSLFSQLVNAGLEVRTSVSINPDTGAAEPGALFTYEALPRSAKN